MIRLLFYQAFLMQRLMGDYFIDYVQRTCANISTLDYLITSVNTTPCSINFTWVNTNIPNLTIYNAYISDFQALTVGSLSIINSTFQMCQLQINSIGDIYLLNVTFQTGIECYNSQIQIITQNHLELSSVIIEGFNVRRQDYLMQLQSYKLGFLGQYIHQINCPRKITLKNVVFRNNSCFMTNMLIMIGNNNFIYGATFEDNKIILGSLMTINEGSSSLDVSDLYFQRNSLSSSQFIVLQKCGLEQYYFRMYNLHILENIIDHLLTDHSRLQLINLETDFRNEVLFDDNNLIQILLSDHLTLFTTSFKDNIILWQLKVVFISSSFSATQLEGITILNNTFQCLEITLFKFTYEFSNSIKHFYFDSSNTRNPNDIVTQSQVYIQFIDFLKTTLSYMPSFSKIYSDSCSMIKSNFINQFPMIVVVTQESLVLNLTSFNISLSDETVLQVLLSQNQASLISTIITDITISRQSYGQHIFDIGAFVISGVFTQFQLSQVIITNLRMGKRSMIKIDSSSDLSISAPFTILIQDVVIQNCQLYVLDHSNQVSIIQVINDVKHNITIKSFKLRDINFFSFPQYQGQLINQTLNLCEQNGFQLNFRPSYFQETQTQILSLQQQTAFLNIQSVYSLVVLQGWRIFNISLPFEQYGIFVVSQTFQLLKFSCDALQFSEQEISLPTQQFLTLYGQNIILCDVALSNVNSMISQFAFIQVMGDSSQIYISNTRLYNYKSTGSLDLSNRPLIQIQTKSITQLQIVIIQILMSSVQNYNHGGLLSLIQLEKSMIFVQFKEFTFKDIRLRHDTTVVTLNLANSQYSQVQINNLIFIDDNQTILDQETQFEFVSLDSINELDINGIFIRSSLIQQALNTTNVRQIAVNNLRVYQSMTTSDQNFISFSGFDDILFQRIIFYSLTSNNTKIIGFYNHDNINNSSGYLKDIVIYKNRNKICCADFYQFKNVNIKISNISAVLNTNFTILSLDQTDFQLNQANFEQNQVSQNFTDEHVGLQNLQNGSIISAIQSQVIVYNSIFVQSAGSYLGGAIYYSVDTNNLLVSPYNLYFGLGVIFYNCSAQFGGAIYHRSLSPSQSFQDITMIQNSDRDKQFNDIASIPDSMFFSLMEQNDGENNYIEKYYGEIRDSIRIQIGDIRSGSNLYLNFQLKEGPFIHFDKVEVSTDEWGQSQFGNGYYTFNPQFVKNNTSFLSLKVFNTLKILQRLVTNLSIEFDLQYRNCLPGEIRIEGMHKFYCIDCSDRTYSSSNNSIMCIDCPINATCLHGTLYQIETGWWRSNFTSNQQMPCDYNACSELRNISQQCSEGYIGPLCEQCDTKGLAQIVTFSRGSQHKCNPCSTGTVSILNYLIMGVVIVCSVQVQLVMTYGSNILQCLVRYTRILGLIPLGTSGLFNASVYIKTMIFHYQILSMLQGIDKNNFMSQIVEKQNIIGNQAQVVTFAADCIYGHYNVFIPSLAYWDVILALLYSLLTMTIGLILSLFTMSLTNFRPNFRKFIILYSYWTQIPQIAYYIGAAISCRNILGSYFVKADLTQTCLGRHHVFFTSALLIPTLIFQIVSGMLGFYLLRKNKNRLHEVKIQTLYGMLFQEYKLNYCYYEIIKLYFKLSLVFLINTLDDSQIILTSMLTLLLLNYFYLTLKIQPYTYHQTQRIDQLQIVVLILTIQLMSISQNCSSDITQYIISITTMILNIFLSIVILSHIFIAYTKKIDFRKTYQIVIKNCPFMIHIIDRPRINNLNVFHNWKILRSKVIQEGAKTNSDQNGKKIHQPVYNANYIPYTYEYIDDL